MGGLMRETRYAASFLFIYLFLISEKPKQTFFPNLMWKWDYYEDNAQVDSLYLV